MAFQYDLQAKVQLPCPWDPEQTLPGTVIGRRTEDRGDGMGERTSYLVRYQAPDGAGEGRYFEADISAAPEA